MKDVKQSSRVATLQRARREVEDAIRFAQWCAFGRSPGDDPEDCESHFTLAVTSLQLAQEDLMGLRDPLLLESRAALLGCSFALRRIDAPNYGLPEDVRYGPLKSAMARFIDDHGKTLEDLKNRIAVLWMDACADDLSPAEGAPPVPEDTPLAEGAPSVPEDTPLALIMMRTSEAEAYMNKEITWRSCNTLPSKLWKKDVRDSLGRIPKSLVDKEIRRMKIKHEEKIARLEKKIARELERVKRAK